MAAFGRSVVISFCAVAVVGHGMGQVVGKWKVKSVVVPTTALPERVRAVMMAATVVFSKDKTFAMTLIGLSKGTWSVKGNDVVLSATTIGGEKVSEIVARARADYAREPNQGHKLFLEQAQKPLIGVLSADRKTLTMKAAFGNGRIVFIKSR